MRISDWSSDVCSSDLQATEFLRRRPHRIGIIIAFNRHFDIHGGPDRMEELVKPRTRLDLVGKAGRIIDQSHQSRSDEGISPLLAPGQCTRITPQIREMGTKFLSKRHCCMDPYLYA